MLIVHKVGDTFSELAPGARIVAGTPPMQIPWSTIERMADAELANRFSIYRVTPAEPPDGHIIKAYRFEMRDGKVIQVLETEPAPEPEIPPPLPIVTVTPAQGAMALYESGLLDQVDAVIAEHPYRPIQIYYQRATMWDRHHPYMLALGAELGLDDEHMDQLFERASQF